MTAPPVYTQLAINARLNGLVTAIGAAGSMKLYAAGVLVSTINLANPCGSVSGGILTFSTPVSDGSAMGPGNADTAVVADSAGNAMITNLSVGIPLSSAQVIISNGFNSTLITPGNQVTLVAAQIQGS